VTIVSEELTGSIRDEAVGEPMPGEPLGYLAKDGQLRTSVRDKFAALPPYRSKIITVDGVGEVEVRSLILGDRNRALLAISDEDGQADKSQIMTAFIIAATYDPVTGEKVFTEDDFEFINSREASLMDKLGVEAMKMNNMTPETLEETEKK
jgi:hypothetical protein